MKTPVGEHIRKLEERLELLNMQVMENRALAERNQIESEIRVVNLALSHYRAALELEKDLSIRGDKTHCPQSPRGARNLTRADSCVDSWINFSASTIKRAVFLFSSSILHSNKAESS